MRYILSSLALLLFVSELSGQATPITPFDEISTFNGVHSLTAPFEIASPYQGVGPVLIYNIAQVDFTAGERIHLLPGFQASQFNGNGYFHAQIGITADFDVVFMEPNNQYPDVGQFEKLEIGVKLPTVVQSQIDFFTPINNYQGMNPFDPDQISMDVLFSNGAQNYLVHGFYYQDFIRDASRIGAPYTNTVAAPAQWIIQPTEYPWRIRWAPPFTGRWTCTISIRLNNAIAYTYSVSNILFNCVPSTNNGWLEKGQNNWNLRYCGNHQSFFALGQNIAWNDPIFYGNYPENGPNIFSLYRSGYLDVLDWTANLADNGGNMVRFVSRPWTYNFEWEHLGNYYEGMNRAWELDQMFDVCEQRDMKIFFCMEFHPCFGATQSDEAVWFDNPYHIELPGIQYADQFLTDLTAQKKYKNKLRYFLSRWGYSTSLGVFQLLSEMDGWYYSSGLEYSIDNNMQAKQTFWHDEMLGYVKSQLAYRSILTSTSFTSPGYTHAYSPFDGASLDITTYHSYHSQRRTNLFRHDEYNKQGSESGTHTLWPDKPTIFDEMGLKFPNLINSEYPIIDHGDIEGCSDISYHNALWSSSMMGGMGTGFNWWQWANNQYREQNFPPLNEFFNDINFEAYNFTDPDFWDDDNSGDHDNSTVEVFYNRAQNRNRIIGWVHNASMYYGNVDENCPDRDGHTVTEWLPDPQYDFLDDDDAFSDPIFLGPNETFKITNVNNLASYEFQWYATTGSGGVVAMETYTSDIFGNMWPTWLTGAYDWGFKAYRSGNNFRLSGEIPIDTLRCSEDTIRAYGNYEFDTLGSYTYSWDFGNGQSSQEKDPIVFYSSPGLYDVILVVRDASTGFSDTLRQTLLKLECNDTRYLQIESGAPNVTVYPNPFYNELVVILDSSWEDGGNFIVYSLDGQEIQYQKFQSRNEVIHFSGLKSGCYFLVIRDAKHEETIKLIGE